MQVFHPKKRTIWPPAAAPSPCSSFGGARAAPYRAANQPRTFARRFSFIKNFRYYIRKGFGVFRTFNTNFSYHSKFDIFPFFCPLKKSLRFLTQGPCFFNAEKRGMIHAFFFLYSITYKLPALDRSSFHPRRIVAIAQFSRFFVPARIVTLCACIFRL